MLNHIGSVNIGSGNGLVPSANKPLPEPMLKKISNGVTMPQRVNKLSPNTHDYSWHTHLQIKTEILTQIW